MVSSHFLITRLTASSFTHRKTTQIRLGSLLQCKNNAFLLTFTSSFSSGRNNHKGDTFTVSYLINSCGFSSELAYKLSNSVNLKTPDGPNAVLDTLKKYGFSKAQVAKLVEKVPKVLVAKAENTLLPKFKFFNSIGVSNDDMPRIILLNPRILRSSLEKCLIPRFDMIRHLVGDNRKAVEVLRKVPHGFTYSDIRNDLAPNIEVLRQYCVPQSSISMLMVHYPSATLMKHSKFVEAVKRVRKFGFNPMKTNFVVAVQVLVTVSKAIWESKLEVYERWGWNCEMALQVFVKHPNFMKMSEEMIMKKMTFLVQDMGLSTEYIASYPVVLAYNLEKRIIPRLSVIKILESKGLIKNNLRFGSFMGMAENIFLKKFVIKFQEDLPRLLDLYKGGLIHHEDVK